MHVFHYLTSLIDSWYCDINIIFLIYLWKKDLITHKNNNNKKKKQRKKENPSKTFKAMAFVMQPYNEGSTWDPMKLVLNGKSKWKLHISRWSDRRVLDSYGNQGSLRRES